MNKMFLLMAILSSFSTAGYARPPTTGGGGSSLPTGCSNGAIPVYDTNTSTWICGLDNFGPLPANPAYNVIDANGNDIGDVVRIDLPFTPTVTADVVVDNQRVIVEIANGLISNNGPVYFQNNNCTGTPYLLASERLPGVFEAVSILPGPGNTQTFYTATNPGNAPATASTLSVRLSTDTVCYPYSDNTSLKLVAHSTAFSYSAPLKIELP